MNVAARHIVLVGQFGHHLLHRCNLFLCQNKQSSMPRGAEVECQLPRNKVSHSPPLYTALVTDHMLYVGTDTSRYQAGIGSRAAHTHVHAQSCTRTATANEPPRSAMAEHGGAYIAGSWHLQLVVQLAHVVCEWPAHDNQNKWGLNL